MARVVADPHHIIVSGQNLSSAAVGKPAHFSMSNVAASLDEIEVNVEGEDFFVIKRTTLLYIMLYVFLLLGNFIIIHRKKKIVYMSRINETMYKISCGSVFLTLKIKLPTQSLSSI